MGFFLTSLYEEKPSQRATVWFVQAPEIIRCRDYSASAKHACVPLPGKPSNYKGVHDKVEGFIQFSKTCIKFLPQSAPKFIQHCRKHVGQQDLGTHDVTPKKPSFSPLKFTCHLQGHALDSPKTATFLEKPVCVNPNQPHGLQINALMSFSASKLHLHLSLMLASGGEFAK